MAVGAVAGAGSRDPAAPGPMPATTPEPPHRACSSGPGVRSPAVARAFCLVIPRTGVVGAPGVARGSSRSRAARPRGLRAGARDLRMTYPRVPGAVGQESPVIAHDHRMPCLRGLGAIGQKSPTIAHDHRMPCLRALGAVGQENPVIAHRPPFSRCVAAVSAAAADQKGAGSGGSGRTAVRGAVIASGIARVGGRARRGGAGDGEDSAEAFGAAEPGGGAVLIADFAGGVLGGARLAAAARGVAAGVQVEEPLRAVVSRHAP